MCTVCVCKLYEPAHADARACIFAHVRSRSPLNAAARAGCVSTGVCACVYVFLCVLEGGRAMRVRVRGALARAFAFAGAVAELRSYACSYGMLVFVVYA